MNRLAKRLRFCAAICLLALYATFVVRPAVALTFVLGAAATHCLSEHHGALAAMDLHGNAHKQRGAHAHREAAHKNVDGAPTRDGGDQQERHACVDCSFSCFGIVANSAIPIEQPNPTSPFFVVLDEALSGRGPSRISWPPIAVLPL